MQSDLVTFINRVRRRPRNGGTRDRILWGLTDAGRRLTIRTLCDLRLNKASKAGLKPAEYTGSTPPARTPRRQRDKTRIAGPVIQVPTGTIPGAQPGDRIRCRIEGEVTLEVIEVVRNK